MTTSKSSKGNGRPTSPHRAIPNTSAKLVQTSGVPRLDEMDLRILEHLVSDARISQRALARSIGMSPPAVAERITRLESSGVLTGYRAVVDWEALGRGMTVTVGVVSERSADQRALAKRLLSIPEVEGVEILTGTIDIRLRLRVRDQAHLREVFFDQLLPHVDIRHTDTSLVMAMVEPENYTRNVVQQLIDELSKHAPDG